MQAKTPNFVQILSARGIEAAPRERLTLAMPSIGDRLREHRMRNRLAQKDIAAAIDVDTQTISNIERGKSQPARKTLKALLSLMGQDFAAHVQNVSSSIAHLATVPEGELRTQATHWATIDGELWGDPSAVDQGLFRIRVFGDCMMPKWGDGWMVEFEIWRMAGNEWPVGRDVVVTRSDNTSTFKRLASVDDDALTLESTNRKTPVRLLVPLQEVVRIGIARGRFISGEEL